MTKNYKIHKLFPIEVYQEKLKEHEKYKRQFLEIYDKHSFSPLEKGSLYYRATGEHNGKIEVHKEKILDDFFKDLKKSLKKYLKELKIPVEVFDFNVTKSWFTYVMGEYGMDLHTHNSSHISFVYYIESHGRPAVTNFATFPGERADIFSGSMLGTIGECEDMFVECSNSVYDNIESEEGSILFFPAQLPHGVPEWDYFKPRISYVGDILMTVKPQYKDLEIGIINQKIWRSI